VCHFCLDNVNEGLPIGKEVRILHKLNLLGVGFRKPIRWSSFLVTRPRAGFELIFVMLRTLLVCAPCMVDTTVASTLRPPNTPVAFFVAGAPFPKSIDGAVEGVPFLRLQVLS
jgi:hypothetical protein